LPTATSLPFATPHVAGRTQATAKVNRVEMLRYLGYSGQNLDSELANRIENAAKDVETQLTPTFTWQIYEVDTNKTQNLNQTFVQNDSINITTGEGDNNQIATSRNASHSANLPCIYLKGTNLALPGTSIARHMDGALAIAAVCTTLGFASERLLQEAASASAADALLYGAAASSLTEQGASCAQSAIDAFAQEYNMFTNIRFSPGYGDLPLDVQPTLARTLNLQKTLGVSLTADNMLIPIKSTTALIGIFDHPVSREYASTCADCPAKGKCSFRQKGHFCYE
jgi:hypothetical protein